MLKFLNKSNQFMIFLFQYHFSLINKNITNMDSGDPYNYPFPTREQTMYLSTISTSFLILQLKMILNPLKPITCDNPHSRKEIQKGLILKYLSLLNNISLIIVYLLSLNPSLKELNILIKSQILSIVMILKVQDLKRINSKRIELWIPYTLSINYHLLHKSVQIQVESLLGIPWKLLMSITNEKL